MSIEHKNIFCEEYRDLLANNGISNDCVQNILNSLSHHNKTIIPYHLLELFGAIRVQEDLSAHLGVTVVLDISTQTDQVSLHREKTNFMNVPTWVYFPILPMVVAYIK